MKTSVRNIVCLATLLFLSACSRHHGGSSAAPESLRAAGGPDALIDSSRNFNDLDASDGNADGCYTVSGNLVIAGGASIDANDPSSPPDDGAGPICIHVSGYLEIQAGGGIFAEDRVGGGSGGDITITVGGDLVLKGTTPPWRGRSSRARSSTTGPRGARGTSASRSPAV